MAELIRCPWAERTELEKDYHDNEWGQPLHDEGRLFEMLLLEGQQAGLSWSIIMKKREALRRAYDGFDAEKIARYGDEKIAELLANADIIRNRRKVLAAISNAQAYLRMREDGITLDALLWGFVDGQPIANHFREFDEVPASTPLSDAISKELKKRGFSFVGTTIIYAYMQAIGIVDDHLESCFVRTGKR